MSSNSYCYLLGKHLTQPAVVQPCARASQTCGASYSCGAGRINIDSVTAQTVSVDFFFSEMSMTYFMYPYLGLLTILSCTYRCMLQRYYHLGQAASLAD